MGAYVVLVYADEARAAAMSDRERSALLERHVAFQAKHGASVRAGDALQRVATARSLTDGLVTDGPFVETKEALGGFYLVEAADLDEAIAIASDVPAPFGGTEVRPVLVMT